ncbi:hypothetical protein FOG26_05725 [Staphylococcus cohnii]|uniref:hypothetical protein n=1 Tax=Staphylococcus cohnii TaxID=29382 RepID=UPI001CCBC96E|nr:hypothetical protein [Staphylococcus cohnii]MBZ8172669.1 hypothetical protein [Staphylococcus cohnii]
MKDTDQIKEKILGYIDEHYEIPIYKLETLFDDLEFDYKGEKIINNANNKYLVYWEKWNIEACNILCELVHENKIKLINTQSIVMLYLLDGQCPNLPLAVTDQPETYSWVPTKLKLA